MRHVSTTITFMITNDSHLTKDFPLIKGKSFVIMRYAHQFLDNSKKRGALGCRAQTGEAGAGREGAWRVNGVGIIGPGAA
jgi:hypothetical protein